MSNDYDPIPSDQAGNNLGGTVPPNGSSPTALTNNAYGLLLQLEGSQPTSKVDPRLPYPDSVGKATVGIGFLLKNDSVNTDYYLAVMGINPSSAAGRLIVPDLGQSWTSQAALDNQLKIDNGGQALQPLSNDQESQLWNEIVLGNKGQYQGFVSLVSKTIPNVDWTDLLNSKEGIALFSMYYGNVFHSNDQLAEDLNSSNPGGMDRADAWFQIRYNSNGGSSVGPGIAKRRYEESAIFGLYAPGESSAADVGVQEATSIYAELSKSFGSAGTGRTIAFNYENQYQAQIVAANADLASTNISTYAPAISGTAVLTLADQLQWAATSLLNNYVSSPSLAPWAAIFASTNSIDPRDIQVATAQGGNSLTASFRDGYNLSPSAGDKNAQYDNSLLIAQGGRDTLNAAGNGKDALIGGTGNDDLIAGTGADYIVAGKGNDSIQIGFGSGNDTVVLGDSNDPMDGGHDTVNASGSTQAVTYYVGAGTNETIILGASNTAAINMVSGSASSGSLTVKPVNIAAINIGGNVYYDAADGVSLTLNGNVMQIVGRSPTAGPPAFQANSASLKSLDVALSQSTGILAAILDLVVGTADAAEASPSQLSDMSLQQLYANDDGGSSNVSDSYGLTLQNFSGTSDDGITLDSAPTYAPSTGALQVGANNSYGDGFLSPYGMEFDDNGLTAPVATTLIGPNDTSGQIWAIDGLGDASSIFGGAGRELLIADSTVFQSTSGISATPDTKSFLIQAGNGAQSIIGAEGNDTLVGGNDTLTAVNVSFAAGTGPNAASNAAYMMPGVTGYDWITGGGGNDLIEAGSGSALIEGGTGADTIYGGSGNDTIFAGLSYFGDGQTDDSLVNVYDSNGVLSDAWINGIGGTAFASTSGSNATPAANLIVAGSGNDFIDGGLGNDTIFGGPGNDTLVGNNGDKTIYGGTGTSVIYADENAALAALAQGGDSAYGANWQDAGAQYSDTVYGGTGNSTIFGSGGNDQIYAGGGNDLIYTGDGNSYVYGDSGNVTVYAGSGSDVIDAGSGNDFIDLGSGNSYAYSGLGNSTIVAGSGQDTIEAGGGNGAFTGGSGADTYVIGTSTGADTINAGLGSTTIEVVGGLNENDIVARDVNNNLVLTDPNSNTEVTLLGYFSGSENVSLSFEDGTAWGASAILQAIMAPSDGGNDTLIGVNGNDSITAGLGDTVIEATTGNNTLTGGAGDDTIDGGSGADTIEGGSGSTTINGGTGAETYVFNPGDGSSTISESTVGPGSDTIQFGTGVSESDVTYGMDNLGNLIIGINDPSDGETQSLEVTGYFDSNATTNHVVGDVVFADGTTLNEQQVSADVSVLYGNGGDILLTSTINGATYYAGDGDGVTVVGGPGNDDIQGGAGTDYLFGGTGNNTIQAGTGSDTIQGGFGSDTILLDGGGNAMVVASAGNDTYAWDGTGRQTIEGYGGNSAGTSYVGPYDPSALYQQTLFKTGQDVLEIGDGLTSNDLTFQLVNGGIQVGVVGTSGTLTLEDISLQDIDGQYGFGGIEFDDGETLSDAQIIQAAIQDTDELQPNQAISLPSGQAFTATQSNELIYATDGSDTIVAGTGMSGTIASSGNNTLVLDEGAGEVTVVGPNAPTSYGYPMGSPEGALTVQLGQGIRPQDLSIVDNSNTTDGLPTISLQVKGTDAGLLIGEQTESNPAVVLTFQFADGIVMSLSELEAYLASNESLSASTSANSGQLIVDTTGDQVLTATGAGDTLESTTGNDTLDPGTGNTLMIGGSTILYNEGDGNDTVQSYASEQSTIQFGPGITATDISYSLQANSNDGIDLVLKDSSDGNMLDIANFKSLNENDPLPNETPTIELSDGSIWGGTLASQIVHADNFGSVLLLAGYEDTLTTAVGNDLILGAEESSINVGLGNDTIVDSGGNTIKGSSGSDLISSGYDTIQFDAGGGHDTLIGSSAYGSSYTIDLGTDITPSDIGIDVSPTTGDTEIYLKNTGDSLLVSPNTSVELAFASGTQWNSSSFASDLSALGESVGVLNDITEGAGGATAFTYNAWSGNTTISSYEANDFVLSMGKNAYGEAIQPGDVTVDDSGANLIFSVNTMTGTYDLTLDNYYQAVQNADGSTSYVAAPFAVQFANGVTWNNADIQQAMITGTSNTGPYGDLWLTQAGGQSVSAIGETVTEQNNGLNLINDSPSPYGNAINLNPEATGADTINHNGAFDDGSGSVINGFKNNDVVELGPGFTPSNLVMSTSGTSLELGYNDGSSLTIENYFGANGVFSGGDLGGIFQFANGNTLSGAAFMDVVNAASENQLNEGLWDVPVGESLVGADGETVTGTVGDDVIAAGDGNVTISGGGGSDTLYSGDGNDTFTFGHGAGYDTILGGVASGATNTLVFTSDVSSSDVSVTQMDATGTLVLTLDDSGESVTLPGYLLAGANQSIQQVTFADGTVWTPETLASMAAQPSTHNQYLNTSSTLSVVVAGSGDDTLVAGAYNDTLTGGSGSDTIYGGTGNDVLVAGSGNTSILGGSGNEVYQFGSNFGEDTLVVDTAQSNTVQFTDGITASDATFGIANGTDLSINVQGNGTIDLPNLLNVAALAQGVGQSLDFQFADGSTETFNQVIQQLIPGYYSAGLGNESITGDAGADTLMADNSDDTLVGGSGKDVLIGGGGADILVAGTGNDLMVSGAGTATFEIGDTGDTDTIEAGPLSGGGTGTLALTGAVSEITATTTLSGLKLAIQDADGSTTTIVIPGIGATPSNDMLSRITTTDGSAWSMASVAAWAAQMGSVALVPGNGATPLPISAPLLSDASDGTINNANDTVLAGPGNDVIEGGYVDIASSSGDVTLQGGEGVSYDGIAPQSVRYAVEGNDLILTDTQGSTVDLVDGALMPPSVTFSDGSSWVASGNAAAPFNVSVVAGADNEESIVGGQGADTLKADTANDVLTGGTGQEYFDIGSGFGQDTISANNGAQSNIIQFTAGVTATDVVFSQAGQDLVITAHGSSGSDGLTSSLVLPGHFGSGQANGAVGQIIFSDGTTLAMSQVNAWLGQSGGAPVVDANVLSPSATVQTAGSGDVWLTSDNGNDTLIGGVGYDVLQGGSGQDIFVAGTGNENLQGGSGNEIYQFNTGFGQDTISTYSASENNNTVQFGAGTTLGDLSFQNNLGLEITVNSSDGGNGNASSLTVGGNGQGIDQYAFADGTVISGSELGWLSYQLNQDGQSAFPQYTWGSSLTDTIGNKVLAGDSTNNTLVGGSGRDTLLGGVGQDLLEAGTGNNELVGGIGDETYQFASGFGQDTITTSLGAANNTIQFIGNIIAADVTFQAFGEDLVISVANSKGANGDPSTIYLPGILPASDFTPDQSPIGNIEFGDGTTMSMAQVSGLLVQSAGTPVSGAGSTASTRTSISTTAPTAPSVETTDTATLSKINSSTLSSSLMSAQFSEEGRGNALDGAPNTYDSRVSQAALPLSGTSSAASSSETPTISSLAPPATAATTVAGSLNMAWPLLPSADFDESQSRPGAASDPVDNDPDDVGHWMTNALGARNAWAGGNTTATPSLTSPSAARSVSSTNPRWGYTQMVANDMIRALRAQGSLSAQGSIDPWRTSANPAQIQLQDGTAWSISNLDRTLAAWSGNVPTSVPRTPGDAAFGSADLAHAQLVQALASFSPQAAAESQGTSVDSDAYTIALAAHAH